MRLIESGTREGAASNRGAPLTSVGFHLSDDFGADFVEVAGDFSAWAPIAMAHDSEGGFVLDLQLEAGRRWRYRFLLDGERWMNDPEASQFVDGPNGSAASVLET
jgi:1,4-alpha-glucan branching enzyme